MTFSSNIQEHAFIIHEGYENTLLPSKHDCLPYSPDF